MSVKEAQGRRARVPPWRRSGPALTLGAILLAEGFAFLLPATAQPFHRAGFLVVLAAVVFAGWTGGLRSALVCGLLGAAGIAHLFLVFGGPLGPPPVRLFVGGTLGGFGLALASLIGHLRDRERRAVEALVREREAAAQMEGRRFGIGGLFAEMGEAVVVADARGRIVLWNPAAERIFGYARDEAMGLDVAALVPGPLKERHREGMRRYRATGRGPYVDSREVLTLPALTKGGSEIVVEMTLSPIGEIGVAHEGAGPFALAIIRDVTERVRLTRELQATNRELAAANASLRDFSHVVAHDLRNPVRGISALAAYLETDLARRLDETQRGDLALLRRESERLTKLLESLLEYSRATHFDASDLRPLHVADVLETEGCQSRFASLARERNARIVPPAPESPLVHANAGGLALILGNLVTNAIRHNDTPEPTVSIRVRPSDEKRGHVEVVVEDNGPGFSEESRCRLQDTLSGREKTEGIGRGGFGLVIVARAAERMGGEVRLAAGRERGAAVHVVLPAAAPRPATSA